LKNNSYDVISFSNYIYSYSLCIKGHHQVIDELIYANADILHVSRNGMTAYKLAETSGDPELSTKLLNIALMKALEK
jgi:hypothetical protein